MTVDTAAKRATILITVIGFGFAAVGFRLADLMLFNHKFLSEKANEQHIIERGITAGRGGILDRKGRPLAVNVDVASIFGRPGEMDSPRDAARLISTMVGADGASLAGRLNAGKKFVWIKRKIDLETAGRLKDMKIKGVYFAPDVKRYYPRGHLGAHVIGFVGVDNQPLEGVELSYEQSVAAKTDIVPLIKDGGGRILSKGIDMQGTAGNDLILTIDEGLQYIAEKELDRAMQSWRAKSAAVIMMDPYNGDILAMANRPTYDLNEPSTSTLIDRRNRAITDTYEPGSTFKLITAAAALEESAVTPNTIFDVNGGRIKIGKRTIEDVHGHDALSFREIIKVSSNVGMVKVGQRLGKERFYKYVESFGFGQKTGIDLPGEASGKTINPKYWSETSQAALSIGYEIAATPLQILRAYCAIANGGYLVTPHMVNEIKSPDGAIVYKFAPAEQKRVISKATAETLRDILVTVTESGGTAESAGIDGDRVAGKTGTARLMDAAKGGYSTGKYASSFVGFVPAFNPRVALIVVIFEPEGRYFGGEVAAPVFKNISEHTLAYLQVPREDMNGQNIILVSREPEAAIRR